MNNSDDSKMKDKLKVVCISDTHCQTDHLINISGDILIHAGDFTYYGRRDEIEQFIEFISKLNFKHKIVIAGNHEISLDSNLYQQKLKKFQPGTNKYELFKQLDPQKIKEQMSQHFIYLENQEIQIEGYKFYGSPNTPKYGDWAFLYSQDQAQQIWDSIPNDTDILITHGPPFDILDKSNKKSHGCRLLREKVLQVKPLYHIFGHFHDSHGVYQFNNTSFINSAILDDNYHVKYDPVIFWLDKKIVE